MARGGEPEVLAHIRTPLCTSIRCNLGQAQYFRPDVHSANTQRTLKHIGVYALPLHTLATCQSGWGVRCELCQRTHERSANNEVMHTTKPQQKSDVCLPTHRHTLCRTEDPSYYRLHFVPLKITKSKGTLSILDNSRYSGA